MSVTDDTISEAREWQAQRYDRSTEKLDQSEVVEPKIPSVHKSIATCCADIGICDLLLGEDIPSATEWFEESVEWGESYFEELRRHEAEVEGSMLTRRPVALRDHMFRAVLTRDEELLSRTAARTERVLDGWDLEEYPRTIPAYFHSRALAAHFRADSDAVRDWTLKMNAVEVRTERERAYEQYKSILNHLRHVPAPRSVEGLVTLITELLDDHHERTDDFRSADDFISIPATAYALLGQRAGVDIGPTDFGDAHDEFLLTPLLE